MVVERLHDCYVVVKSHAQQVEQSDIKSRCVEGLDDHVETVRSEANCTWTSPQVVEGVHDLVDDMQHETDGNEHVRGSQTHDEACVGDPCTQIDQGK